MERERWKESVGEERMESAKRRERERAGVERHGGSRKGEMRWWRESRVERVAGKESGEGGGKGERRGWRESRVEGVAGKESGESGGKGEWIG